MKTITLSLLVAAGILSAGAAQAADEEALAKSKNCLACHAVAKKYAGQKDAEAKLSEKVIKGGKGVWGEIPMPPNASVTPAESTKLVKWILGMK